MSNDQSAASTAVPVNPPAAPKKKRRLMKFVLLCFVMLIAFVLLVPTIVSTSWGTSMVLSFVNKSIKGRIDIGNLDVGWFSGTKVEALTLTDPAGNTFVNASLDAPQIKLLSVIRGNLALGTITAEASQLDIVQYDDGTTNLDRTFGPSQPKPKSNEPTSIPANLSVKLRLTAPKITFSAPNMEQAVVSNLDVQADVDTPQSISAAIKAGVAQGKYSGSVDGKAAIKDAFDAKGLMQATSGTIDATFALNNLPSDMIGNLAKQGNKVTVLVGPDVTTIITAKGKLTDLTAELSVAAERMKIQSKSNIALTDDFKLKKLTPEKGQLAWLKFTPESHAAWAQGAGRLVEPFEVTISHDHVSLSGNDAGIDKLTATGAMNIRITPIRIDTGTKEKPDVKELDIKSMSLAYDGPKAVASAVIEAVAKQGNKSGTLLVKMDLSKPFDAKGDVDYKTLDGTIDGQIKDFALGVVDDLMGTQGLLTSVLGDKLNAAALVKIKPTADGKGGDGTITLTANSADKLNVNIEGAITARPIEGAKAGEPAFAASANLTKPGIIELLGAQRTLTTLANRYPDLKGLAEKLKADESANLRVTLTKLSAPLDATMMKKAVAELALNVGAASFDLNAAGQSNPDLLVKIEGVDVTLAYSGEKNQAIVTADAKTMVSGKPGQLKANVSVSSLFDKEGKLDAASLAPVITADLINMPTAVADAFINKGRLAHYGIGPVLNASVKTTITQVTGSDGKKAVQGPVLITAKADNLDVVIDAQLKDGRFNLVDASKSYATLIATPALFDDLKTGTVKLGDDMKDFGLAGPSKITVTFSQLDVPLDAKLLETTGKIGFSARIDQIVPKGDARLKDAAVRNLVAMLKPTSLNQPLEISVTGDLIQGTEKGKIDITANIADAMADNRKINAKASITNTPTALADSLAGQGGLLLDLFGPAIEAIVLTLRQDEPERMVAGYDIKSQLATGVGGMTIITGKSATTSPGTSLRVTLSPQGFASIQRKHGDKLPAMLKDVILVEPTLVDIAIDSASFALAPLPVESPASTTTTAKPSANASPAAAPAKPLPINAANSRFKVSINTKGPFIGKRDFDRSLRLDNLKMVVHTPQNMNEVAISLDAETAVIPMVGNSAQLADAAQIQRGMLTAKVNAKNLADKDGRVTFANLGLDSLVVDAKGQKLPVDAIVRLLALNSKITGVLGPMIDEVTVVSRKGGTAGGPTNDLVARLVSANADINVTGLYTDNLRLTDNAVAKLHMNEILSNVLFEPMTGGLLRAEKSEKPVVITLHKDGFALPGTGFDVANMNANIDFDFNSMKLKPLISLDNLVPAQFKPLMAAAGVGGLLESELGEFLGKFDKYAPTFDKFSASISNGTLKYSKPMTFTLDKYTVALDGTVNLKTMVPQMLLGIPKAAFSSKLQKFMGSEGYLFVPFTQKDGKLVPDSAAFGKTLSSAFSPANLIPGVGTKDGKPDIGGAIGDLLGGKKKDDKDMKDAPKVPPATPPTPPTPTPGTPAPSTDPKAAPATPTPAPEKKPDLGTAIGDLIGGKKKDDAKKDAPKETPKDMPKTADPKPADPKPVDPKTTPAPVPAPVPTPAAPATPPQPQVDVSKLAHLDDAGKAHFSTLMGLRADRSKFKSTLEDVVQERKVQSLFVIAHVMHQLPDEGPVNANRLDTKIPRWMTYDRLKTVISVKVFDTLCDNYLKAVATGKGADEAHAAMLQWIKENEAKLQWSKGKFVLGK